MKQILTLSNSNGLHSHMTRRGFHICLNPQLLRREKKQDKKEKGGAKPTHEWLVCSGGWHRLVSVVLEQRPRTKPLYWAAVTGGQRRLAAASSRHTHTAQVKCPSREERLRKCVSYIFFFFFKRAKFPDSIRPEKNCCKDSADYFISQQQTVAATAGAAK